mmetsp:Transcript_57616/g.185058  ORF Transcript_57616/g.185058 Transcript_57616/m.185058 type:complete len:200 (-) Transcript_57616:682-1281(-)
MLSASVSESGLARSAPHSASGGRVASARGDLALVDGQKPQYHEAGIRAGLHVHLVLLRRGLQRRGDGVAAWNHHLDAMGGEVPGERQQRRLPADHDVLTIFSPLHGAVWQAPRPGDAQHGVRGVPPEVLRAEEGKLVPATEHLDVNRGALCAELRDARAEEGCASACRHRADIERELLLHLADVTLDHAAQPRPIRHHE